MYKKYKTLINYGITSDYDFTLLPEDTVNMILDDCFMELDRIPENIYRINKNNLDKIDINTKIHFLKNIESIKKEESIIIENADVLSELDDLNVLLKALPSESKNIYIPKDNILYNSLYETQRKAYDSLMSKGKLQILLAKTGSGKTITALSYAEQLYIERKIDKIIVILANDENVFLEELSKHLPMYSHNRYHTMTYYNMEKKLEKLRLRTTDNVLFILDEIHLIKNDSKRGKYIREIHMEYMLGLTATLFDKASDLETLSLNIGTQIVPDMVTKMDMEIEVDRELIEVKLSLNKYESDEISNISKVYKNKLELQHNIIQKLNSRPEKMAELLCILEKHKDDKIILFTNYLYTASSIHSIVGDDSMVITGGDTKENVGDKIRQFFYGKFQLLITTSVINQSYNLQQANVIIFFDFNYDSVKAIQTEGRILRIGQDKKCYIYYIYHIDTIEEEIFLSIMNKRKEYDNIIEVMT